MIFPFKLKIRKSLKVTLKRDFHSTQPDHGDITTFTGNLTDEDSVVCFLRLWLGVVGL